MKTSTSGGKAQNTMDSFDADTTAITNSITLDGKVLREEVDSFTYLDSIIDEQGGSDADANERIGKVGSAFSQLENMCNWKQLSTNIKVRNSNTNVDRALLYGAGTCRPTTTIIKKIQLSIKHLFMQGSISNSNNNNDNNKKDIVLCQLNCRQFKMYIILV
ncbi:unnamed protein product [Schistosoma margrebowiei]|uniref:Uncharacterized protein n=1 Tax=Schistosoma margrebowiei TaxID=48269 RepID=A0A183MLQ1_9TREM|nr:unnamed protein product [Schistosoma margrebowiei]